MIDLYELSQLVAFAELGTLSRVAEKFHISTPSITRSMQNLEKTFGVSLFLRGKNRIELNETGKKTVEYAKKLLQEAEQTVQQVQMFDQRQHTIVVKSCAPAPLWEIMDRLSMQKPNMMVSSAICSNEEVLSAWENGSCDIAVLPFPFEGSKLFMKENLYVCVPKDHELARHTTLSSADINGFNFLLRSELGFWDALCREKMPASKFLVQDDVSVFNELVKASSLPCFITDYREFKNAYPNRIYIPLTDKDVHVTFYLAQRFDIAGINRNTFHTNFTDNQQKNLDRL